MPAPALILPDDELEGQKFAVRRGGRYIIIYQDTTLGATQKATLLAFFPGSTANIVAYTMSPNSHTLVDLAPGFTYQLVGGQLVATTPIAYLSYAEPDKDETVLGPLVDFF